MNYWDQPPSRRVVVVWILSAQFGAGIGIALARKLGLL